MKAEIITSGTELLLGETTDTNTPYIAGQLAKLGINLYFTSTVGDNFERYSEVLRQAWDRSDLIITTGGLGPTQGDITREVIAGMVGEKMAVDPDLKKELTEFFSQLKLEMTENNLKQAALIPSAVPLRNASGTAPGWWVEKEGRIIITLPGPPREMQAMWNNAVLPRLGEKGGAVILSRTIKTWGLPEAKVDEMVSPYLSSANPTLAMYAKAYGIQLRITARADTREIATALISEREREIKKCLKNHIWGFDDETLEGIVGQLLCSRKLLLAIAESFTGGLLASTITSVPDWHNFFMGGLVISNDARAGWSLNKVCTEAASRMASLARNKFAADIGLAIDGYGEPGPGAPSGKIFIAVDNGKKTEVTSPGYPGRPEMAARRTVNHALMYLKGVIDRSP